MKIKVATLFPEMFDCLRCGIIGRAIAAGILELEVADIRAYSADKHRKCDDAPFGGGAGMVMTPQPIHDCIAALDPEHRCRRIYMSPRGRTLSQPVVTELASETDLLFLCGSYEGIDERIIELDIDDQLSIGDYVLTGGELPAMVAINALARYVDGVLGSSESVKEESFVRGLLEYPQYTRPQEFEGLSVPEVLRSGNHGEVAKWRLEKQLEVTRRMRPDLAEAYRRRQEGEQ